MATITKSFKRQFGTAPYGNLSTFHYQLKTDATGAVVSADSTAPVAAGDVVRLGRLPEGLRLEDADLIISTGMTATITGSLGFLYVDGGDDPTVPQDAAYFGTGLNLAAAARLRTSAAKALVTLPKPAYLVLTTAAAANAKASLVDVLIKGELSGDR